MLDATPTVELWLELGRRLAADETEAELAAVLTVAERMLTAVREVLTVGSRATTEDARRPRAALGAAAVRRGAIESIGRE